MTKTDRWKSAGADGTFVASNSGFWREATPGRWRRRSLFLVVLAAAMAIAAGCTSSNERAAGPRPTIGSAAVVVDEQGEPRGPETSDEAPVIVDEVIGDPLGAEASAEEILVVVNQVHGPTADVSAQMNRFVDFPLVGTPAGATIIEVRADLTNSEDEATIVASSSVVFTTPEGPDDVLAFYDRELTGLGWEPSDRPEPGTLAGPQRRSGYRLPESTRRADGFAVLVRPGVNPDGTAVTEVRLHHEALLIAADDSTRDRYIGWASSIPLPPGGEVTGAGIQTTSFGRNSLHYFLDVRYDGQSPGAVADQLLAGLPTAEISADEPLGAAFDDWVYLESDFFDDARVSTVDLSIFTGSVATVINVDARAGFDPSIET